MWSRLPGPLAAQPRRSDRRRLLPTFGPGFGAPTGGNIDAVEAACGEALGRLVDDPERFGRELWGRRPHRWSARGPFSDLLTTGDVESLLRRHARRPEFRVVREGPTIPVAEYTRSVHLGGATVDDVADLDRVLALVADGATVVLQGLQHTWDPLARFCASLEAETTHAVQANAYLSPSGSTALRRHTDTHDVLAVQIEGAKHWEVDGLGELVTEPGDVLYIPTGVAHAAGSRDRHSLHVTIGIHARTTRQALMVLVDGLLAEGPDAPLPIGFAHADAEVAAELRESLRAAASRLAAELHAVAGRPDGLDALVRTERERPARRRRAAPPGTLAAVLDVDRLDLGTTVRLHPGVRVAEEDGAIIVSDVRRQLTVPQIAAAALRELADVRERRVELLPGLDPESRLVLARRLVREGFALPVPVTG